jgi:hypothetical protein
MKTLLAGLPTTVIANAVAVSPTPAWITFDFSADNIMVTAGQVLGFSRLLRVATAKSWVTRLDLILRLIPTRVAPYFIALDRAHPALTLIPLPVATGFHSQQFSQEIMSISQI